MISRILRAMVAAGLGLGLLAAPSPAAAVARQIPKDLLLKTNLAKRDIVGHLYAPRAGLTGEAAGQTPSAAASDPSPTPVVFFSGEWGWRPMLQDTASYLLAQGRTVLGIESNEYFAKNLDGGAIAADLRQFRAIANEAAGRSPDSPVILAGFAYGAEMIPYLLNRARLFDHKGLLLVAPDKQGAVIYRVTIQLKMPSPPNEQYSVEQEMLRLPPLPVVLMQGTLDTDAQAQELARVLRGPHHYVPIAGGDRQFHEARDAFFTQAAAALRWFDQGAPAQKGAPPPAGEPSPNAPAAPAAGADPAP